MGSMIHIRYRTMILIGYDVFRAICMLSMEVLIEIVPPPVVRKIAENGREKWIGQTLLEERACKQKSHDIAFYLVSDLSGKGWRDNGSKSQQNWNVQSWDTEIADGTWNQGSRSPVVKSNSVNGILPSFVPPTLACPEQELENYARAQLVQIHWHCSFTAGTASNIQPIGTTHGTLPALHFTSCTANNILPFGTTPCMNFYNLYNLHSKHLTHWSLQRAQQTSHNTLGQPTAIYGYCSFTASSKKTTYNHLVQPMALYLHCSLQLALQTTYNPMGQPTARCLHCSLQLAPQTAYNPLGRPTECYVHCSFHASTANNVQPLGHPGNLLALQLTTCAEYNIQTPWDNPQHFICTAVYCLHSKPHTTLWDNHQHFTCIAICSLHYKQHTTLWDNPQHFTYTAVLQFAQQHTALRDNPQHFMCIAVIHAEAKECAVGVGMEIVEGCGAEWDDGTMLADDWKDKDAAIAEKDTFKGLCNGNELPDICNPNLVDRSIIEFC